MPQAVLCKPPARPGGYDSYASGNLQRDPEIGLFCVLGELSHQAGVPECSVQIVLRIEELVKGNAPEPAYRRKGGALHVHRDAALLLPPGHVPAGSPGRGRRWSRSCPAQRGRPVPGGSPPSAARWGGIYSPRRGGSDSSPPRPDRRPWGRSGVRREVPGTASRRSQRGRPSGRPGR